MKFKSLFVLLIILLSAFVFPPITVKAAPGETPDINATGYNFQRQTFNASTLAWLFYPSLGGDLVYSSTADYVALSVEDFAITTAALLSNSGTSFSVWYDGTYVHVIATLSGAGNIGDLYYRRGQPFSNGSIVWTTTEQQILLDNAKFPSICVDSNGYPWVGYSDDITIASVAYTGAFVIKGEYNNGTWGYSLPIMLDSSIINIFEEVENGSFDDWVVLDGWTSSGVAVDHAVFHTGNSSAQMNGSDWLKQQWQSSTTPFAGGIPLTSVDSWGFWSKGNAGAAWHHWYVAYVVANNTFYSKITYLPDGAYDWTYFDVKASLLAWKPSLFATGSNATAGGIYYKSDTTAAIYTWIDDVSMLYSVDDIWGVSPIPTNNTNVSILYGQTNKTLNSIVFSGGGQNAMPSGVVTTDTFFYTDPINAEIILPVNRISKLDFVGLGTFDYNITFSDGFSQIGTFIAPDEIDLVYMDKKCDMLKIIKENVTNTYKTITEMKVDGTIFISKVGLDVYVEYYLDGINNPTFGNLTFRNTSFEDGTGLPAARYAYNWAEYNGVDYNTPASVSNTQAHTGTYSLFLYENSFYQNISLPVDMITSLSYWIFGSGSGNDGIKIYYTNGTVTDITIPSSIGVWLEVDLMPSLTSGLTIEYIYIYGGTGNPCYLDDITLVTTISSSNILTDMISDGNYIYISSNISPPAQIYKLTANGFYYVSSWTSPSYGIYATTYYNGYIYAGLTKDNVTIQKIDVDTMANATLFDVDDSSYSVIEMYAYGLYLYVTTAYSATEYTLVYKIRMSDMAYMANYTGSKATYPEYMVSDGTYLYVTNSYTNDGWVTYFAEIEKLKISDMTFVSNWTDPVETELAYITYYDGFVYTTGQDTNYDIFKINTSTMVMDSSWFPTTYPDHFRSNIINDGTYIYSVYNNTTPILVRIDMATMATSSLYYVTEGSGESFISIDSGLLTVATTQSYSITDNPYITTISTTDFNPAYVTSDTLSAYYMFSGINNSTNTFFTYASPTFKIYLDIINGVTNAITSEQVVYTSAIVSTAKPVICKTSADDIIVLWANDPVVNNIYFRGYRKLTLALDASITKIITDATMTANTFITIFQESYSPVGVAYMTLNVPPYTIVLNGVLTGLEATVIDGYLADPDTGLLVANNMYSMYRYYYFYVEVLTPNNPCDVTDVYLTVQNGTTMRFKVHGSTLDVVPAWSIVYNGTQIDISPVDCNWTIAGNTGSGYFSIETKWNFTSTSDLDVYVEAVNPSGSSGIISTAPNSFDVVSDLVATIETAVHDIFFGTQAEVHGGIFYEADPGNSTMFTGLHQPPDSQFTKVEVYNGTVVSAQDIQVLDGNYSVIFIPYFSLANTQNYTLRLYMKAPYVSGPPANNPTLTLYLTANWVPNLDLIALLQKVFDLFGMTGAVAAVVAFLNMLGASIYNFVPLAAGANWFLGAMFAIVTYVGSLATIFFNFTSWFFYWVFTMAGFISNIVGIVIGILNGTLAVGGFTMGVWTGLGNIWTTFGGTNLMLFLPFVILIVWMQSLDSREKTMGINFVVLAVNDFQTVYGLINVLTGFAIFVYSVVVDWARWIFGYLTSFFTKMFSPI